MSRHEEHVISAGTVLEFYESKEILLGVVLAVKEGRFNVLSERNREVSVTPKRVVHHGRTAFNPGMTREDLLKGMAATTQARCRIRESLDIEELWSLVREEESGFTAEELAEFVFSNPLSDDQVAAAQQLLLQDRLYFQSRDSLFYPRSEEDVEQRKIEIEKEAQRERKLAESAKWVQALWARKPYPAIDFRDELIEGLKSYALFGQEAKQSAFIKDLFKLASIPPTTQSAFRILVRLGVWREDENLLLHEHGISPDFSDETLKEAERAAGSDFVGGARSDREDLTTLEIYTVDSILTRDYDDALSIRKLEDGTYEVGVHIADAAELVQANSVLDREAKVRASSIYLPDGRISMLPPSLSEGVCSLKAGEERLALSFFISLDDSANITGSRIVPSIIRIAAQLTYEQVNERIESGDAGFTALYDLALKLRQKRIDRGATILPLPEIQVYVNNVGMILISRYEKEAPSQILVSEWMIWANAAAADFFADNAIPAIFRAQAECRPETEFVQSEHELFFIYRKRRLFARAELATAPKAHCSLSIPHYTTVTSPIRRYADLVVQRQLKHALSTGDAFYSAEELGDLITHISASQARIFAIQRKWTRYWLLKYLEQEGLENLHALVLEKNSRYAHLLVPEFLLEVNAQVGEKAKFQQGELVRVHVDKIVPREDVLKIQVVEPPPGRVS
ncbi:MAG: RNB domain-containing ribonuclease [Desulfobacteraceae bacterium]|nr:RNB domain-containing ribonuclease [Desulfobacteraceae bacterium]